MKQILNKVAIALGFTKELSAEEMLNNFIAEQKHATLLSRINSIRTHGGYVPDYNLPKVYTDTEILYQESPDSEFKPISYNVVTTCERPIDFGNDIKAWKKIVQLDHKKTAKEEKEKQTKFDEFIAQRAYNFNRVLMHFMRVE